ncbi:hypothetical protein [Diaminobutyricimonas sp. TR449]|uniref:hypothetical protein n=1 Tax=Diaminobutyricimonas sp. TR449 TaxID=2708076 RepID=UPI00142240E2|nr:hypothetical protein [Diaminobutyricimonas sp. TR449]
MPAAVIIAGKGLTIRAADGSILQEVRFTDDPATAIDMLGEVFDGAPALAETEAGECVHAESTARWGEEGFVIGHGPELPLPEDLQFHASTQTAAVGDIVIETPTGFAVGDSIDDLAASIPDAETESADFEGVLYETVHYEFEDTSSGKWGAFAWAEDDIIQGLAGGYFLSGDC